MNNRQRVLVIGFLMGLIICCFLLSAAEAAPEGFSGQVVSTDGKVIRVRGADGRISVFWLGRKTKFDSGIPIPGDRVTVEYVKDTLRRNAATRVTILGKEKK